MPATELAHPIEDSPVSVQEYKRIQQFPDDWIICGKITDQYRQIGNAVPVGLGEAIGRAVVSHSKGKLSPDYPDFNYSRYRNTNSKEFEKSFINQLGLTRDSWIFLSKVRHDSSESTPLIPGQSTPLSWQQSSRFWRASV